MYSNRSNYEVCECPNSSGRIEYACNCGNPAVFLCSACVVSHLSKPSSHTFISIEQARALRNSEFNQQFTESFSKFMSLKTVLHNYQEKIGTFITQTRAFKPTLKSLIDQVFDAKISQLEGIRAEVSKRIDEVSRQMSCLDQTGLATLEKYAASGLDGIIPQYYDNLELREEDIKYEIMNSIIICKGAESSKHLSYRNLVLQYNKLYQENNELQITLKSYADYFDQIKSESERKQRSKRNPHDLSYEESLERYRITIVNSKIQYYDRLNQKNIEYPINLEGNSKISQATCCLSPDGNIFILAAISEPIFYSPLRHELWCKTFKFDKGNFTCVKLSDLNVKRSQTGLCFNGEYLYAFGGFDNHQGKQSGIAERMKWASQGWVKLPDMQLPRVNCRCYSVKNFIIIYDLRDSNRLEYFDVNTLKYTLIEELGFYTPSTIKRIDDLIYIMNLSVQNNIRVAVLSDEMKLIQSSNNLQPNTLCCFGLSRKGEVETICFSYSDMKLKLHDVYDPNYAVINEVSITLLD